ncbi:sensor histidine kinase [Sunxiuqinia indica]|uniref:sensor histidine kinase n=1 Tax=Sunxiuqinia indica TaxID=2692584 RepID=UPI0013568F28|nr:HAMP domain-containing sensor histidine kinase [Sunxiuqinia indica]
MKEKNRLAYRETLQQVLKSRVEIGKIEYVRDLLAAMSSIICILNDYNQVVFSNDEMFEKYNLDLEKHILGVRPGEIFKCVNAVNNTGGCGTTEKCQYCGAKTAFDDAWGTKAKIVRECRIACKDNGISHQLDFEITATPIHFDKEYLIVSINDITEKKRKALLERIFFHDVLNIAGGLSGVLEVLPMLEEKEKEEYLDIARLLSEQIVDEIKSQQQMIKAEAGELQLEKKEVSIQNLMNEVASQIRFNDVARNKKIDLVNEAVNEFINTDRTVLIRVLINMVKNAMEAIKEGEHIVLKAEDLNSSIRFSVHNKTYIPREIQMQIFQRSYSTKGKNRGLGTYSMKLLGERYLNGNVGFTSTHEGGTSFYIDLKPDH